MMRAGGEAKRRELIYSQAAAATSPLIKKQLEDLTLGKDRTKMTKEEEYKGKYGDHGQAENLMKKKRDFTKK